MAFFQVSVHNLMQGFKFQQKNPLQIRYNILIETTGYMKQNTEITG